MATATRGTKRSAAPAPSNKNSRNPTGKSRAPTQAKTAASKPQTRAQSKAPPPATAGKQASKPASKAGTRQGTRASQKKPSEGPVLAVVGEDGQIVVGDEQTNREGDQEEEEYYDDDDEYYDEDYDEEEGEEGGGEEDYVEEAEEEEEFDYSTFQYKPYGYKQRDPDEPRAVIETGPEGCSCFPSLSSSNVPSMLYDKVECSHEKLQGYAHLGVYRFDDNWDSRHEASLRPKLIDRLQPNKGFVWGYPNFVFVAADEPTTQPAAQEDDEYDDEEDAYEGDNEEGDYDEEGGEYDEDGEYDEGDYEGEDDEEYDEEEQYDQDEYADDQEQELKDEEDEKPERDGYYDEYGDYHYFEDEEGSLPSRMYDSEGNLISREPTPEKPPSAAPKPSSALEAILPKIGFSPEPSLVGSRLPTAEPQRTPSLPPITPASQGSQWSVRSRERTPVKFKPRTLHRKFQGKYYDPVTKESYEFEITPDFRKRIDRWQVKKEGIGKHFGGGGGGWGGGGGGGGGGGSVGGSRPPTERGSEGGSRAPSQYSRAPRLTEKHIVSRW